MSTYLDPGLYTKETDYSFYVKQISTASCAMIGVTQKGKLGEYGSVTSWDQFVNKYGSYIRDSYLPYAAKLFFDNGGQVLYVYRVTHYTDITDKTSTTASPASKTHTNQASASAITVTALDYGTHGQNIGFSFEPSTRQDTTAYFNMAVYVGTERVELHENLSMDEDDARHVDLIVNLASEVVNTEDLLDGNGILPTLTLDSNNKPVPVYLEGGNDGLTGLTDTDYIGDASSKLGIYAFDKLNAVNMICAPGVTSRTALLAFMQYCELRKDCMFIADTPMGLEPLEVIDFRTGAGYDPSEAAPFSTSYAAMYWPWVYVNDPLTGGKKLVPPSGGICGIYARNDQKANVWSAPAGIQRGVFFGASGVEYLAGSGDRQILYPQNINTIAVFDDSGITVWGQKTLQIQPSATDRVNVRRLMMFMEVSVASSGRFVVFEANNPQTYRALERLINPFLQQIQDDGGLYDKKVQCDQETTTPTLIDRNEIRCRVFVKPTKTAEFIEINFILSPTGGKFDEILGNAQAA